MSIVFVTFSREYRSVPFGSVSPDCQAAESAVAGPEIPEMLHPNMGRFS